jgi:hypothetical protein
MHRLRGGWQKTESRANRNEAEAVHGADAGDVDEFRSTLVEKTVAPESKAITQLNPSHLAIRGARTTSH